MSHSQLDLFAFTEPVKKTVSWQQLPFLCVDTETTGLEPQADRVIEIAWLRFHHGKVESSKSALCKIGMPLPGIITRITGINDGMLDDAPEFSQQVDELVAAFESASFIVAYNANFDKGFIEAEFARLGRSLPEKLWIDPLVFIKEVDKFKKGKKLKDAAERWGVKLDGAHRAMADAQATGELLYKLAPHLKAVELEELHKMQIKWAGEQRKSFDSYRASRSQFGSV